MMGGIKFSMRQQRKRWLSNLRPFGVIMQRTFPLCVAGILTLSVLTGCSSPTGEPATSATATEGGTVSSAAQASVNGTDAPVIKVDTENVIATQEFTVPGSKDKVNVGIQSLTVEGKTMTLQFVLTPDFASSSDSSDISIYDMFGMTSPKPTLVDRENLKEYSLISAPGRTWSAEVVNNRTTNHEPIIWWGVYAAPEDENETFDVRVIDSMAEFADVPVTR